MTEESIFAKALTVRPPAERPAYLAKVCAGDPALLARVRDLLRAHESAGSFLLVPARLQSDLLGGIPAGRSAAGGAARGVEPTITHGSTPGGLGPEGRIFDFLAPPRKPGSLGRLGHYEVLEVVGRGGMGVVFRAFDETLQRVVAIKTMAGDLAASATARKRFTREAQAAAAICHEHVVTIHAVDEDYRPPYLVMQFIEGASLQEKVNWTGPLDPAVVLRIGIEAAYGLAAAHKQGLVHRDIKPANILLEAGTERVKITDFGLARAGDDATLTRDGMIAGTPAYMSPEQAEGRPVDHRSDLFSLGSVLYAMGTGLSPFRGGTAVSVLKRVCHEEPRPLREANPDAPEWLAAIITKLHAKDPAGRYQSAAEVAGVLARRLAILQRAPAAAPPEAPDAAELLRKRLGLVLPPTLADGSLADARPRPARARRLVRAAALAGALAILAAGLAEGTGITHLAAAARRSLRPAVVEAQAAPAPPPVAGPAPPTPAAEPARPAITPEPAWLAEVEGLGPEPLAAAVVARLIALNPEFDGAATPLIEGGEVTGLRLLTDAVADISPLKALPRLAELTAEGSLVGEGRLVNLEPLRGRRLRKLAVGRNRVAVLDALTGMPLRELQCAANPVRDLAPLAGMPITALGFRATRVKDLAPLGGMKLHDLDVGLTEVADLGPLAGMPLETLNLEGSKVVDLAPLAGLPLRSLDLTGLGVTDLAPLAGMKLTRIRFEGAAIRDADVLREMPLEWVECSFQPGRDAPVFRGIASLQQINGKAVEDFWRQADAAAKAPALMRRVADFKARARVDFLQGQNVKAIDGITKALAIAPEDAESLALRGDGHHALGHLNEALDDFNRAVAADPDSADIRAGRGYVQLDVAPMDPATQEEALADFDAALKLDPANAEAHLGRFFISRLRRHGKHTKGEAARLHAAADKGRKAALKLDPTLAPYVAGGFVSVRLRRTTAERQRQADLASNSARALELRREELARFQTEDHQRDLMTAQLMINVQAAQWTAEATRWRAVAQQEAAAMQRNSALLQQQFWFNQARQGVQVAATPAAPPPQWTQPAVAGQQAAPQVQQPMILPNQGFPTLQPPPAMQGQQQVQQPMILPNQGTPTLNTPEPAAAPHPAAPTHDPHHKP